MATIFSHTHRQSSSVSSKLNQWGNFLAAKDTVSFLSDNEHSISKSAEQCDAYFFYLVFFNGDGEPTELRPILASDLYEHAEMVPASYVVRFEFKRPERDE